MDNFAKEEYNKLLQLNGQQAWETISANNLDVNNCLAIAYIKNDFILFKILVDNGASVFAMNEIFKVPNFITFDKLDRQNFLEYAYSKISNLDQFDASGMINLLLFHSYSGNYDAVEWLIKYGADVNVIDGNGNSPFSNACRSGNLEIVKILLTCEPTGIYNVAKNGISAIKEAQSLQHNDVVMYLLENGYEIEKIPDLYYFIYEIAFKRLKEQALEIARRGIDISKVHLFKNEYFNTFKENGVIFYPNLADSLNKLLVDNKTNKEILEILFSNETTKVHHEHKRENEEVEVVKVKYFPNAYKEYTFIANGIKCNFGDKVIVYTNGKEQEVIVSKPNFVADKNEFNFGLKEIIRKI